MINKRTEKEPRTTFTTCKSFVWLFDNISFVYGFYGQPYIYHIHHGHWRGISTVIWIFRSSHQSCSIKKPFLKFTGKHMCRSLFFNNIVGLRPIFGKKMFSCEFCEFWEIFKSTFFTERLHVNASEFYSNKSRVTLH